MSHLPVSEDDLKAARRAIAQKGEKPKKDKEYQPLHAVVDDPSWYRKPEPEKEDASVVTIDIL